MYSVYIFHAAVGECIRRGLCVCVCAMECKWLVRLTCNREKWIRKSVFKAGSVTKKRIRNTTAPIHVIPYGTNGSGGQNWLDQQKQKQALCTSFCHWAGWTKFEPNSVSDSAQCWRSAIRPNECQVREIDCVLKRMKINCWNSFHK